MDHKDDEMLGASPQEEEMEEVLSCALQEDGDPPNRMPGQLFTEKEQPLAKGYTMQVSNKI